MGRLPDVFAGRRITFRAPYIMEGALRVATAASGQQYPDATFMHSVDKPFEIHRMIPRIMPLDSNNNPITPPAPPTASVVPDMFGYLLGLIRARIHDLGKNLDFTKSSTYLWSMVKGSSEMTWEFAEPYYLDKGEQLQVILDSDTYPAFFASSNITQLRVHIAFEGFQLVCAPASDNR